MDTEEKSTQRFALVLLAMAIAALVLILIFRPCKAIAQAAIPPTTTVAIPVAVFIDQETGCYYVGRKGGDDLTPRMEAYNFPAVGTGYSTRQMCHR